jgi:polyisoprenoid-binding protein YceI
MGPLPIAAVACVLALAAPAAGDEHLIDLQKSTVTVRVYKSGFFSAFADDHVIQAPLLEGSFDDTPHVQIVVDARRMKVLDPRASPKDRSDVQTRMLGPEVLDVNRFEQIRFHSVAIHRQDGGGWRVEGELELHGQIHPVDVNVALERGHYKGSTSLKQSTFGITPISIVGGTVKVKDEVRVEFDIVAAEP